MIFLLDNLTSKKNLNLFSTPKFTDIQINEDNPNKSNFFNCESLSKDAGIYGSKNMNINILEDLNNKMSDNLTKNKEDSNQNNKDELILKENFSLSSIGKYHTNNNNINIINININNNKKMDKDEKNNIALMSFCDKLDNYSFNNYSCSTYKDKKEKNNFNSINNMKSLNEAIYSNESEIKKIIIKILIVVILILITVIIVIVIATVTVMKIIVLHLNIICHWKMIKYH